jgi:O-antigen ligase
MLPFRPRGGGQAAILRPIVNPGAPPIRAVQLRDAAASDDGGRLQLAVCTALVLWGVAAFGAVYEWGLVPLLAGTALSVATMWTSVGRKDLPTAVLMCIVVAAALFQLIPVSRDFAAGIENRAWYLDRVGLTFSADRAPFSIVPVLTSRAVLCLTAFAALGTVLSAWFRERPRSVSRVARNVAIIGAVFALEAVVQKGSFNGRIYWFWESEWRAPHNYFGPFVNRNHFAGWIILALAVAAGHLAGAMATRVAPRRNDWRHRILWVSTPEAAAMMLWVVAIFIMLVALVWSMSRSGIAGGILALAVVAIAAMRRVPGSGTRILIPLAAFAVIALAIGTKGADALADWYATTDTLQWRFTHWQDAMAPLRDFWLTGSGLNTYGVLTNVYPQSDWHVHASEAHNDYLQLAIEGGVLVGVPVLMTIAAMVRTVARRLRAPQDERTWWIRMGAVAGICGIALQEVTDFSLQIPGIALLFTVVVAIAIHEPPSPRLSRDHRPPLVRM